MKRRIPHLALEYKENKVFSVKRRRDCFKATVLAPEVMFYLQLFPTDCFEKPSNKTVADDNRISQFKIVDSFHSYCKRGLTY